jgi:phage antirepressor YoqD-like protein
MYRLGGDWVPYANHSDAGRFSMSAGIGKNDHAYESAKFTPKGVEWVAKIWAENLRTNRTK